MLGAGRVQALQLAFVIEYTVAGNTKRALLTPAPKRSRACPTSEMTFYYVIFLFLIFVTLHFVLMGHVSLFCFITKTRAFKLTMAIFVAYVDLKIQKKNTSNTKNISLYGRKSICV